MAPAEPAALALLVRGLPLSSIRRRSRSTSSSIIVAPDVCADVRQLVSAIVMCSSSTG
jgi:hypothetical protein